MRTKFKKLTSLCIVVIMILNVLTVAPLTAGASETDSESVGDTYTSGDFEYTVLDDGTAEITGYNGSATELEIPSTLDGHNVTGLGYRAFSECISLINVKIPSCIISIGVESFSNCANLENVDLSFGLTSIGECAFSHCTKIKKIRIPDSVQTLERHLYGDSSTFYGCSSLEEITLPKNIDTIGGNMFTGCTSLKTISIPSNVGVICNSAFSDCTSLTEIIIPDSVKEIEAQAFRGCINLKNITIPDNIVDISNDAFENTYWYNNQSDGVIYLGNVLYSYKGEMSQNTSIKVLEGTRVISQGCFKNYENLENIDIPDTVINIGNKAFYNTTWFKKQSEGIVYAGKIAYSYKGKFTDNITLEFKDGTKGIADNFIPDSQDNAFIWYKTVNVTFPESLVCIGKRAFEFDYDKTSSLDCLLLPSNLQYICSEAFSYLQIKKDIKLPDDIRYVGEKAFFDHWNVSAVYFPNSNFQIQTKSFGYALVFYYDYYLLPDFTIYGYTGSTAETYANKNGFQFVSLGEVSTTLGDVDGDGKISIDDVTDIQKYIANTMDFTEDQMVLADVDKDGKVAIDDVTLIQKHLAGMAVIE